jgi:DNA-binding MarR family transcriptional regulator
MTEETTAHDLREAMRPMIRRFNVERTISLGEVGVLSQLFESGRNTASTLAAAEHISRQAVTMIVRELEKLGLIKRTPDDEDRRRVWIEITPAGEERLAEERSSGQGWLALAIEGALTPKERETLKTAIPILRKLTASSDSADED